MLRIRHPRHRTGVHTDAVNTSSGTPGPPIITAILDQPPGRAAERLAPPGRLKRVLDKAHLHLGDLLPDTLRVAHLRSRCELLRVVYEFTPTIKQQFWNHSITTHQHVHAISKTFTTPTRTTPFKVRSMRKEQGAEQRVPSASHNPRERACMCRVCVRCLPFQILFPSLVECARKPTDCRGRAQ